MRDMLIAAATLDVEIMTDAEVLNYVDSQVVNTRDSGVTMGDYRDKAIELLVQYWENKS